MEGIVTEKEKMLLGKLYNASDAELQKELKRCRKLTRLFNNSTEEDIEYRSKLLKDLFGKVGENIFIEPTFRCDYGKNIYIGDNFAANYDCIILDVCKVEIRIAFTAFPFIGTCKVEIGNNVMFGPRVSVFTAGHPIDADVRITGLEFGKEIKIGNNVWIGGNTVITPGVKIGDNVIIGAASVVTKDIEDNVIAVGNPCKILRKITEKDKIYWNKKKEEYFQD